MDETPNKNMAHQAEEIINHEQFEDMRDLLEEDFADLIQVYITDSQQRVSALRVAQQENDNANGFEVAHALKGQRQLGHDPINELEQPVTRALPRASYQRASSTD